MYHHPMVGGNNWLHRSLFVPVMLISAHTISQFIFSSIISNNSNVTKLEMRIKFDIYVFIEVTHVKFVYLMSFNHFQLR